MPRDKWLYLKLYGQRTHEDDFVLRQFRPFVRAVLKRGEFRSFFFLYYRDPKRHLRVRFLGEPSAARGSARAISKLARGLELESGEHPRIETALYRRDKKRYGGLAGVRIAERVFFHDSCLALDFMALRGQASMSRTEFALASAEALLAALGLDLGARDAVWATGVPPRSPLNPTDPGFAFYESQLAPIIRRARRGPLDYFKEADPRLRRLIAAYVEGITAAGASLRAPLARLERPIPIIAHNYLHLHFNRLGIDLLKEQRLRYARARAKA